MNEQYTIHPGRTIYGSDYKGREATHKLRSRAKHEQVIAAVAAHCERHPHDGMKAAHLSKLRAAL